MKLAVYVKQNGIKIFKPAQLVAVLTPLWQSLLPNNIWYLPLRLRDMVLELTQGFTQTSQLASELLLEHQFIYTVQDIVSNQSCPFRGYYWSILTQCFSTQSDKINHFSGENLVQNSSPNVPNVNFSIKTASDYFSCWGSIVSSALRDILQFFSPVVVVVVDDDENTTQAQNTCRLQWKHLVYTIDIITSLFKGDVLISLCIGNDKDQNNDNINQLLADLTQSISILFLMIQNQYLNIDQQQNDKNNPLLPAQKVQHQQSITILTQLYQTVVTLLSGQAQLPDEEDIVNVAQKSQKSTAKGNKPTPKEAITDEQREFFAQKIKNILLKYLSPLIIPDMIILINQPDLQSDIFFVLLLLIEMSPQHLVFFSFGQLLTPITSTQSTSTVLPKLITNESLSIDTIMEKPTPLSVIMGLLSNLFNKNTTPAPFSPNVSKPSKDGNKTRWLLQDESLTQLCCCLLDLIVTTLQQSATTLPDLVEISTTSQISIIIRHYLIKNGLLDVITTFSQQVNGELSFIRAKQAHSMKNQPQKGQKGRGKQQQQQQQQQDYDTEDAWIPSYIITNRLFYIISSLFSFSHQAITFVFENEQNDDKNDDKNDEKTNILNLITNYTTFIISQLSPLQTSLNSLFLLFNPCDARNEEVFDNNETCDSLYAFLLHTQLYEYILTLQKMNKITPSTNSNTSTPKLEEFFTTLLSNLENTIKTVKDTTLPTITLLTQNDKAKNDNITQLVQRSMTILSMVDDKITYDP